MEAINEFHLTLLWRSRFASWSLPTNQGWSVGSITWLRPSVRLSLSRNIMLWALLGQLCASVKGSGWAARLALPAHGSE